MVFPLHCSAPRPKVFSDESLLKCFLNFDSDTRSFPIKKSRIGNATPVIFLLYLVTPNSIPGWISPDLGPKWIMVTEQVRLIDGSFFGEFCECF